jgi:hypothetical protein
VVADADSPEPEGAAATDEAAADEDDPVPEHALNSRVHMKPIAENRTVRREAANGKPSLR